jgi:chromosome partitioning protein
MNDSHIDLDVLVRINPSTGEVIGPSIYTRMVNEQRILRKGRDGGKIEWIIMRNRLARRPGADHDIISLKLQKLAVDFDFRLGPGFGERPVFRELFPQGLTLFDLVAENNVPLNIDAVTARQEVRTLLRALNPQALRGYRNRQKL